MYRMISRTRQMLSHPLLTAAVAALLSAGTAHAASLPIISGTDNMQKYTSLPATSVDSAQPQAMIQLSKDHQLFFKAFNDYTDLDKDGTLDITYKHGFDYYGYFDSYKCYTYDTTAKRFVPSTDNDQIVTEASDSANNLTAKYCSGAWSGNFLNWASMTRIDVVRKILFGGKRSTDESSKTSSDLTVLERSYLPNDAHSFAKYYNGSDIAQLTPFSLSASADPKQNGISICNTTVSSTSPSQDVTDPPLIRVAKGNFSLWGANERWQCRWAEEVGPTTSNINACNNTSAQQQNCNGNVPAASGIDAYPRSPQKSSEGLGAKDYVARIEVCKAGYEAGDRCKTYPTGTKKPIGLFQEYGDTERMWFGMIAGTYDKNKQGGDLIKNMGPFTDEVNVNVDGRFLHVYGLKDASGSVNGKQQTNANGLVNALSLYRITQYKHSDGTYGTSGNNQNNCEWGMSEFANGTCQNWGNPFGEAYLNMVRYYGNLQPVGAYRANDSTFIPGLNVPQNYESPLDATNSCASLNVVTFNSSTISYDGDNMDGPGDGDVAAIGSTKTSKELADIVGAGEGIHGGTYFVGTNGTNNNQTCTPKKIDSLGDVTGICPEAPRLEGTFKIAGIAWYAHTNDINSDKNVPGEQTVETYAVSLASNIPKIEIPVPGTKNQTVTLLPACKNLSVSPSVSGGGACAIVDFKIVEPYAESGGIGKGKFYVNWEDSEQGGDFDQDMWGVLSYEITSTQIAVTTDVIAQSTPYKMGFGYVLSGTSDGDGFHAHSGINDYTTPAAVGSTECSNCKRDDAATTQKYLVGTSSAKLLKDPLWYAAKWGGFDDSNGNNIPDLQSEWDTVKEDGSPGSDGIPDNYFLAIEPRQLEEQLRRVFDQIIARTASGTAASVVANAREGIGAVFQALFEPVRSDKNGNEVRWIGNLNALWVDSDGYLREDGDHDAKLDDYGTDPVVEIFFDENNPSPSQRRTKVRRFSGDPKSTTASVVDIDDLNVLWSAREQLAKVTQTDTQRAYGAKANTGRYIKTFVDVDLDGVVDNGEFVDFTPSNFGAGRYGLLNTADKDDAQTIIEYIRGKDFTTPLLRNRTLDYDGDGTEETMRLGDIVNSTPTVVQAPAEAFDLLYNDQTYGIFRQKYANRRQVVYVGANDGMLHAFNAGFFDPETDSFKLTGLNSEVAHPLGTELWAYVPFNLLPHLTWLTDTDYTHVWYVDGKPRVFDARIYDGKDCKDATNPCGWATLLVVGFRYGGGDLTLPEGGRRGRVLKNALQDLLARRETLTTKSGYVVMDITDPEQPPKLLAEIANDDIGFSTSYPTVIANSAKGKTGASSNLLDDEWYLIFGNGPNNLDDIQTNLAYSRSNRNGKLYAYDLKTLQASPTPAKTYDLGSNATSGAANSFVTDPVTVDWDLDFKADAVYFGTVNTTTKARGKNPEVITDASGKLFKLDLKEKSAPADWVAPAVLLNPGMPVVSTPSVTFDEFGNRWIFSGTGRFYTDEDKPTTFQNYLFGLVDYYSAQTDDALAAPPASAPYFDFSKLVDVSAAVVTDTNALSGVTAGGSTMSTVEELAATIVDSTTTDRGWKVALNVPLAGAPSERNVTQSSVLGDILFATGFTPSDDLCGGEGGSRLYGLYYKTGTALGTLPVFGLNGSNAIRDVYLGAGLAAAPSLHVGGARDNRGLTVLTQTSTGAIERREALIGEGARSKEIDWREIK
ncbi:MAG: PilC/PilY family type IV pilus protein [Nevskiales bacterium]|nr:PilC/PilY family type IV pilus protein [Nevskiales bacterium]